MEQQFNSRSRCGRRLSELLQLDPHDATSAVILEGLTDFCEESGGPTLTREIRLGRWVVRDEDLDLLAAIKDALLALATVKFAFLDLTAAGFTAIALAMAKLLRNAYLKGATVTSEQVLILSALQAANRPMPFKDLLAIVNEAGAEPGPEWNDQQLRCQLERLLEVPTRSGSVKLVAQYSGDMWGSAGV